ncbi:hypothetical protein MXB_674, partial [Myxobolus squamalis]
MANTEAVFLEQSQKFLTNFNLLVYYIAWKRLKGEFSFRDDQITNKENIVLTKYAYPCQIVSRTFAAIVDFLIFTYFFSLIVIMTVVFHVNISVMTLIFFYLLSFSIYDTFCVSFNGEGYQTIGKYLFGLYMVDSRSFS